MRAGVVRVEGCAEGGMYLGRMAGRGEGISNRVE